MSPYYAKVIIANSEDPDQTTPYEDRRFSQSCHVHLPTYKISYNIGMTHNDFIAIFGFIYISSVEIFSKCCLYSGTVLVKLLRYMKREPKDNSVDKLKWF